MRRHILLVGVTWICWKGHSSCLLGTAEFFCRHLCPWALLFPLCCPLLTGHWSTDALAPSSCPPPGLTTLPSLQRTRRTLRSQWRNRTEAVRQRWSTGTYMGGEGGGGRQLAQGTLNWSLRLMPTLSMVPTFLYIDTQATKLCPTSSPSEDGLPWP